MTQAANPNSIARVTEIIASSPNSFDDAINKGIERATETLEHIEGVWVKSHKLELKEGRISAYRVVLKLTFVLKS